MMAPTTRNFSAFDSLAAPPPNMGMAGMSAGMAPPMPRGPMGMGMGMNTIGMGQPGMMMGGGGMGFGAAAPPMMMPPQQQQYYQQPQAAYGGVRPQGGSRDPFAGLGLPGK
jgi:hypothetical protein